MLSDSFEKLCTGIVFSFPRMSHAVGIVASSKNLGEFLCVGMKVLTQTFILCCRVWCPFGRADCGPAGSAGHPAGELTARAALQFVGRPAVSWGSQRWFAFVPAFSLGYLWVCHSFLQHIQVC